MIMKIYQLPESKVGEFNSIIDSLENVGSYQLASDLRKIYYSIEIGNLEIVQKENAELHLDESKTA